MSTISPSLYIGATPNASQRKAATAIPWYLWCIALATTCSSVGVPWDISWHRSIGRDSFFNPAHVTIYLSAIFAACSCGYLILTTTFSKHSPLRAISVQVLGLRGPFGAFVASWGGIAMLTSAPFDDWWHNAYGLDVKIVSPPHTLLFLGMRAVGVGAVMLLAAQMNRSAAENNLAAYRSVQRLLLYVGVLFVVDVSVFIVDFDTVTLWHSHGPYETIAIAIFPLLAILANTVRLRWTATIVTGGYMVFMIGQILLLPLFPAHPKLGPVYNPVTHMVPMEFPILMVVAGVIIDLIRQRFAKWPALAVAFLSSMLATTALAAVSWPFADFLFSSASRNRFFGTMYGSYNKSPASLLHPNFQVSEYGLHFMSGLLIAGLFGTATLWIGTRVGQWMQGAQR
jgi:hypothetical protein